MTKTSVPLVLFAGLLGLSAAGGCAHTVLSEPVDRRGDGWTLTIRKVTVGPNQFNTGNVVLKPEKGERFVWVVLTLHNDQSSPRKFNFDRCDLDAGGETIVPSMIDHDFPVGYDTELEREPSLAAGESIDRRLVFVYPKDRSPTRLSCAPMVLPLPQL